jgi:deoxyribodipyrimidine photo-lyase
MCIRDRGYVARLETLRGEMNRVTALRKSHDAAIEGRTGIEPFDAWAAELVETGYLHNHARMWFASIWIFTLRLPWELGADFFHRHLLDGDPASNTLSWRWVAGLHTAGKTYLARADNIETYTAGRFKVTPDQLARTAPALGFDGHPPPLPLRDVANAAGLGEATLLITEEDCQPETLELGSARIVSALMLDPAQYNSGLSETVIAYKRAALADAARRAQAHFGCDAVTVSLDDLANRAAGSGPQDLVTAYIPVGPLRDAIGSLPARLALHEIRRDWDSAFWPHATHGFFKLREKIPSVLGRTVLRLA